MISPARLFVLCACALLVLSQLSAAATGYYYADVQPKEKNDYLDRYNNALLNAKASCSLGLKNVKDYFASVHVKLAAEAKTLEAWALEMKIRSHYTCGGQLLGTYYPLHIDASYMQSIAVKAKLETKLYFAGIFDSLAIQSGKASAYFGLTLKEIQKDAWLTFIYAKNLNMCQFLHVHRIPIPSFHLTDAAKVDGSLHVDLDFEISARALIHFSQQYGTEEITAYLVKIFKVNLAIEADATVKAVAAINADAGIDAEFN